MGFASGPYTLGDFSNVSSIKFGVSGERFRQSVNETTPFAFQSGAGSSETVLEY